MYFIAHRINNINQLKKVNNQFGIEIDIRDQGGNLVVVHDPFKKGAKLDQFLRSYKHKILIANIKSERIEEKVIELFRKHKVKNYFFLDSSFPKIIDLIKKKFNKIAIRVSHYEGMYSAKKLKGKAKWIWYDTFNGLPSNLKELTYLKKKLKYKICIVCPELHKIKLNKKSKKFILLKKSGLIDAVCTKEKYFTKWL